MPTLAVGASAAAREGRLSDSSDDVPPASLMHEDAHYRSPPPPPAQVQSPPRRVPGDLEQGEPDESGVFGLQASARTQTDVDDSQVFPGSDLF